METFTVEKLELCGQIFKCRLVWEQSISYRHFLYEAVSLFIVFYFSCLKCSSVVLWSVLESC